MRLPRPSAQPTHLNSLRTSNFDVICTSSDDKKGIINISVGCLITCYRNVQASNSPPARKPLPRVKKPNLHSDRGQDSNPCAWRPLGLQSTYDPTVPR
ncbi:hypothetical protein E2C01_033448 [Portunus trituberculatus]|uniref:Uncharacterized protein n=1 Tax=Portunus trituberculatus TaxID=210409 RepID=A0A5B7F3G1_PORTR|nr:hypothetical protein [Portunus trituberculatus]